MVSVIETVQTTRATSPKDFIYCPLPLISTHTHTLSPCLSHFTYSSSQPPLHFPPGLWGWPRTSAPFSTISLCVVVSYQISAKISSILTKVHHSSCVPSKATISVCAYLSYSPRVMQKLYPLRNLFLFLIKNNDSETKSVAQW